MARKRGRKRKGRKRSKITSKWTIKYRKVGGKRRRVKVRKYRGKYQVRKI